MLPHIFKRLSHSSSVNGIFNYTLLPHKSYIKLWGPESVKFLNGMITSKLQPQFTKKNLMTIDYNDTSQGHDQSIIDFPVGEGNWGLYQEEGPDGPHITRFGQYTGFLNGKGKLVSDSIVYPTPPLNGGKDDGKYPVYLLEFDDAVLDSMVEDIRQHKLGSRIKYESLGRGQGKRLRCWDMMVRFNGVPRNVENPWVDNLLRPISVMKTRGDALLLARNVMRSLFKEKYDEIKGIYVDHRFDGMIYKDGGHGEYFRVVTSNAIDDLGSIFNGDMMPFDIEMKRLEDNDPCFRKTRLHHGFVDGIRDIRPGSVLPLELNFDYIPNVINSNKGCYVGQELTARTISTGVLRKRLISVKIERPDLLSSGQEYDVQMSTKYTVATATANTSTTTPNPFGQNTTPRKKKPVGTLLAHEDDVGILMMRTEHFPLAFDRDRTATDKFYIDTPGGPVYVVPTRPVWYSQWLQSNKQSNR